MKKATTNELARRLARFWENIYPWDFYEAWESFAECVDCTRDELIYDPVEIWNQLDDAFELVDVGDDLYLELVDLQAEVAERVSSLFGDADGLAGAVL